MPRPKKEADALAGPDAPSEFQQLKEFYADVVLDVEKKAAAQAPALPPRAELPALLAKAKRDGDQELIAAILAACAK